MKVSEARDVAKAWVREHAPSVPGLWAVYFGGSINWLPDDAELGPHSDIDLWHLIKGKVDPGLRQRKIDHEGLILEPCYMDDQSCANAEAALGDWRCGIHLTRPSVIYDPTGELGRIQKIVEKRYAEPFWVRKRCESIAAELRGQFLPCLRGDADKGDPYFAFGFVVNEIAQIPAVASVRPLTVRKGGMVFSDMMRSLHQEPLIEELLEILGSARMNKGDVGRLLEACAPAYDRAVTVRRTPFYGDFDLYPASRRCMIDGARDLIDRGYHREAAWWIYVAHYFSRVALGFDAPEEYERIYRAPYESLLDSLGAGSAADLARKAARAEELLSRVMVVADSIVGGRL